MPEIKLEHLTAKIHEKLFLRDLTLTIEPGQQWAVIGPNGCGKSAFGRLLCNCLEIVSGTASLPAGTEYVSFEKVTEALDNERYNDDSDSRGGADPGTSVRDFILMDQNELEDQLHSLAEELKFSDQLNQGIKFLSTGEMRKTIVCKALLCKPELLVLDEPFDGLDVESCQILKHLISRITGNGTQIVLLLNRFSEILPEVSHIAYLKDRRIMTSGPKEELLNSTTLRRIHAFHYNLPSDLPARPHSDKKLERSIVHPVIEMHRVVVRYAEKMVLNNLDWTVRHGEHWIIAGPNGSGKSTLLNLITGDNTQAYANDISLFGIKKGSGESVWEIKQRIGYISTALQRSYRIGGTALSVVLSGFHDSIGLYRQQSKEQLAIAGQWLKLLHMENHAKDPFQQLSFGEQRLILIIRAMVKQPELLILDEPCQGLDDINREMVLKLIDFLGKSGTTQILYVTHHPEDRIPCIENQLELILSESGGSTAIIRKCE